jgi:hypothetical protein
MKETFAAHGMRLLAPTDYLDTPEKKSAYESFKLETGGKGGLTSFLNKMNKAERRETSLIGAYAYMFGPNPVADTGQRPYWTGHQYTGAWVRRDVPLIQMDKDSTQVDFDGSGIVARALAERTAVYPQEEIARP